MRVPKKFAKTTKSFLQRLHDGYDPKNFGTFCTFPINYTFNGQDKGENIVLLLRRHPVSFIKQYFVLVLLLLSPIFVLSTFRYIEGIGFGMTLGVCLFMILLSISFSVDLFFKWYYSVNIITDQRIVDVDFDNILYHRFSDAQLEKIEDVTHVPAGVFSSIFDYGNVFIQTAAAKKEFDFYEVPRARDVQDTLSDLLEMKQKGQI